jgi:hypothetical protein
MKKSNKQELEKLVGLISEKVRADLRTNEENTIIKFILPLFEILGWDQASDEVEYQHTIKTMGRADIILKIGGEPIVIIEAKKFNSELTNDQMRQAMKYKTRARWIVTTNGKELRLYDRRKRSKWGREFFSLKYDSYREYSDLLELLSRKKIEKLGLISDKYLEWKKLLKTKAIKSRNKVTGTFLTDSLKENKAIYNLIRRAVSEVR